MGIFYNPPPPPTANNAGTPPERHVPIGTQGNQPPRYTTALMMVAVLASWPADLEPRLTRPNDQRTKIAPLTFTYGSQPTPQGPLTITKYGQLVSAVSSWPIDVGPLLPRQPPPTAGWNVPVATYIPARPLPLAIRSAWDEPFSRPPTPVAIAPLTLLYGTAPIPQPPISTLELAQLVASWPVDVGPSIAWPNWAPWRSVVVAQPRVDQPPPQSALSRSTTAIALQAWVLDAPASTPLRSIADAPASTPLRSIADAPICRLWKVDAQSRLFKVRAQNRALRVAPQARIFYVQAQPRTFRMVCRDRDKG